jgi:hypothetical protein
MCKRFTLLLESSSSTSKTTKQLAAAMQVVSKMPKSFILVKLSFSISEKSAGRLSAKSWLDY